jgi:hypothetical protein
MSQRYVYQLTGTIALEQNGTIRRVWPMTVYVVASSPGAAVNALSKARPGSDITMINRLGECAAIERIGTP